MQIERLKVFVDVVECMSFTRAAERGFISQSAVSQQIAALEKELGVTLLLRDRKGNVSPTVEGETFYRGCVQVISAYEKTLAEVRNISSGDREIIILGLIGGAGDSWLSDVMKRFVRCCPGVRVMPVYESFQGLRRGLENGRFDAAMTVRYDIDHIEGVACETLLELQSVVLASVENPISQLEEVAASSLADQDFITTSEAYGPECYHHWMAERRREGYEPRLREVVDSAEALRVLVEINAGIAILPEYIRYDKEKCRTVRLTGTEDRVQYVLAHREKEISPALQTFITLTKEYFDRLAAENAGYSENS